MWYTHAKIRCARRLPRAGPRADKQAPHATYTQQVCECSPPRRGNQLRKLARRCASPDTNPRKHDGRHQSRPQMASVWPCVFEHKIQQCSGNVNQKWFQILVPIWYQNLVPILFFSNTKFKNIEIRESIMVLNFGTNLVPKFGTNLVPKSLLSASTFSIEAIPICGH